MRLLFLGDIVGRPGRKAVTERLPRLRERWRLDCVVINGENAAGGFGITEDIFQATIDAGADVVTPSGVATITMLRPGLTHQSRRELLDVVREVAADDSVRAVVLTGTGRAFCVGQDLGQHVEALRGDAATSLSVVEDEYNPLVLALASSYRDKAIANNVAAIGEVGLTGEIRAVNNLSLRLGELSRLGFTRVLIPHQGSAKVLPPEGMTVVRVKNIRQAIDEALED